MTISGIDLEVEYVYHPELPGKLSGPPETCYPAEPEEVEIYQIKPFGTQITLAGIISDSAIKKIEKEIRKFEKENKSGD